MTIERIYTCGARTCLFGLGGDCRGDWDSVVGQLADGIARIGHAGWFLLLLAPFVGSFLGTLIRRLPERRPLVAARSCCEACGARLEMRDLVPLASWVLTRGRCRRCGAALGWFYPGVELAAFAVAAIAMTIDGPDRAWIDCLLGWWLLALGWIDLRAWLLPDVMNLPLIVLGLLVTQATDPEAVPDRAAAAAIGYIGLRAVDWVYHRLRGREGLGQGDAKLFAAAGAWLGTGALPTVLLVAGAAALLVAVGLGLAGTRLRAQTALPFGPFLAVAIWQIWLFGLIPV